MKHMAVVECISSGRLYIDDIISHGYSAKGDITNMSDTVLSDGFVPTMWFSIIILMLALLCTLSVKNKIVKKE